MVVVVVVVVVVVAVVAAAAAAAYHEPQSLEAPVRPTYAKGTQGPKPEVTILHPTPKTNVNPSPKPGNP